MSVYILGDEHNRIKIGFTHFCDGINMYRFQVANADKLTLIRFYEGAGRGVETDLHWELKAYQIRDGIGKEWFKQGRAIIKALDAYILGVDNDLNVKKYLPSTPAEELAEHALGWGDLLEIRKEV